MALNYEETKFLIAKVLLSSRENVQATLKQELDKMERTMPEFYEGVILHGPFLTYTSDQWLDFHQKVPHWRLQNEKALMAKLSPNQREKL